MRTYQHSGIVPILSAIQSLAAGTTVAIVLGIVYTFSFYYIPYVYLNFLLAMGFGAGVGWVVGWMAYQGRIRNTGVTVALAVVAALVGIYFEWGTTLYALAPAAEIPEYWKEAGLSTYLPHAIVAMMAHLYQEGSWGLTAGQMVKGWPLVMLWLVEAGVIVGLAATTAFAQIANKPFCEACNEWITGETPHFYQGNGSEPVWTEVQNGNFDPLADTEQATGGEPIYMRIKLHVCETCTQSNYLTITRCENTIDDKGNPKLVENDIVTNLDVDDTQVELIRTAHLIAPIAGMPPLGPPVAEPSAAERAAGGAATASGSAPGGNWTLRS
ncbi:MAG: hypothetical protein L0211_11505 [Planctomycetaceae bacterium]|nr:hypothetical protein [Planctomycetaceae bacterium]